MRLRDKALLSLTRSHRFYQSASFTVRQNGFRIPITNGMGRNALAGHNKALAGVVRSLAASGRVGTFIDVGANQGQCLLMLAELDLLMPYRAFEPNPDAAFYLQRLIAANNWPDCAVLPVALSRQAGTALLNFEGRGDESSTIDLDMRPSTMYSSAVRVAVAAGAELLGDVDRVFLLKLDCEGHEYHALEGLRSFIAFHRPPIFFEVLGYGRLADGTYPREYFGELTDTQIASLLAARDTNCWHLDVFFAGFGYEIYRATDTLTSVPSLSWCLPGEGEMDFYAIPRL